MALKKSQLYSSLWQSCDELRGGMDASQYKDHVLTLLFMKYVSDKHASDPDALIEVTEGGGFDDMAKLKGDKEIGDRVNKIIGRLAEANPPFSAKAWSSGLDPEHDVYGRFAYGVPPAKNGDYAFLLHLVTSLKSRGKGAIILPHGALFRGNREADIRRELVQRGLVKGIIGLPANLFYGTGIPACIVVLDKEGAATRDGIFMIDASSGFIKDGNKNRLREQDIHRVVDVFNRRTTVPSYSRLVPLAEIAGPTNDYNLNLPRYINSSEPEDLHDLDAHLRGGIPNRDIDALGEYWDVLPGVREALFADGGRADNGREGYSTARIDASEVKATILGHGDFRAYAGRVGEVAGEWREAHEARLLSIDASTEPKSLIGALSEDLLRRFSDLPLLDAYDVYQRLMDYWNETMQDDVYLIVGEGWFGAAQPREIVSNRNRRLNETPDLVVKRRKYKFDLIPPALVVARHFAEERRAVDAVEERRDAADRELEEFIEEHAGEDGPLESAVNDTGKVTKASAVARLRAVRIEYGDGDGYGYGYGYGYGDEPNDEFEMEERQALERCIALFGAASKASSAVKKAQAKLDTQVLARYAALDEHEIKRLAVEDKWLASIRAAIKAEVERLTQRLAARIQEIEERYARPLPELERNVETFSAKVAGHLRKMGISV